MTEDAGEGPITDLVRRSQQEVLDVERFLEEWVSGRLNRSEMAFARLSGVLAATFHIVGPTGEVFNASQLLDYMRRQYGADPKIRRWVNNSRVGHSDPGLVVVVFEEWQVRDGLCRSTLISATFREKLGAPNKVQWIHIQETPLSGWD